MFGIISDRRQDNTPGQKFPDICLNSIRQNHPGVAACRNQADTEYAETGYTPTIAPGTFTVNVYVFPKKPEKYLRLLKKAANWP
jgi:hypothetical protein